VPHDRHCRGCATCHGTTVYTPINSGSDGFLSARLSTLEQRINAMMMLRRDDDDDDNLPPSSDPELRADLERLRRRVGALHPGHPPCDTARLEKRLAAVERELAANRPGGHVGDDPAELRAALAAHTSALADLEKRMRALESRSVPKPLDQPPKQPETRDSSAQTIKPHKPSKPSKPSPILSPNLGPDLGPKPPLREDRVYAFPLNPDVLTLYNHGGTEYDTSHAVHDAAAERVFLDRDGNDV
jgi:hypothetical protein